MSIMRTTKPSLEVAARTACRLRDEAASIFDTSLGDPGPGRSVLEQQRTKPLQSAKPISISAAHGGGNAARTKFF
jgi:hypothetical protein